MDEPRMETRKIYPSKREFCQFCRLLYERRLAVGTGGNVAARSGHRIWLTPTGISLRDIQPADIAVVDANGILLDGRPSTKEAGLHLGVLRTRPDIHVVLHVHGDYIIAASLLLKPGPCALPALTPGFVYHAYPLAMLPFMAPGSPDLAAGVAQALSEPGARAVLLQNHGLVTVGKDFHDALNVAEEIDEAARVHVLVGGKGPAISDRHIAWIQSFPRG